MPIFDDLFIEKCGNSKKHYIVDVDISDQISGNTWTLDGSGYVCRKSDGSLERMHEVVIYLKTGKKVPDGMYVDHINQCKTDNRMCNLRLVLPQESSTNMPIRSNNTTGVVGVSRGKNGKGFRAYITVNKRLINLGTYPTLTEAARARNAAEEKYGFKSKQDLAFLIELEEVS